MFLACICGFQLQNLQLFHHDEEDSNCFILWVVVPERNSHTHQCVIGDRGHRCGWMVWLGSLSVGVRVRTSGCGEAAKM